MAKTLLYIANVRLPTDNAHGLQIMKTCEALAAQGIEVTLLHPWRLNTYRGDPFDAYRVKRSFRLITLPSFDTLQFGRAGFWFQNVTFGLTVSAYLLSRHFDVVYSRDELPLLMASYVARPCFWESHTGRHNRLIAALLRRVAGLVVISNGLRDLYAERGFSQERIIVAPDAVSLEDFAHPQPKEEARSRLGLPLDVKIALYIGKLDGWKGVDTFCGASAYMVDVLCVVIGGDPGQVKTFSEKYPKVRFLGWRPYGELSDNQAAADVLVLPNTARDEVSLRFTSPLKLFSYMASGRPIACSNLPSLREILDDISAFWFTPDDSEDCARALREALTSDAQAVERAAHAAELVQGYSWGMRARAIRKGLAL